MTKTEWEKKCRAVEQYGSARIYTPGKRGYAEIIKNGPGDYAVFAVYPGGVYRCTERYCIATGTALEGLRYMFE